MVSLNYRCPLCDSIFSVSAQQVGTQIECPKCSIPIRIDAPVAIAVRSNGDRPDRTSDERTIVSVHPVMLRAHPFRFLLLVALFIGGIAFTVIGSRYLGKLEATRNSSQIYATLIGAGIAATGLIGLIVWYIANLGTTLTITTNRTRLVRGLIARSSSEVQHDDVRNIQVNQGIIQRMINVGDLAISSSGQDDLEIAVNGIASPERLASEIRRRQ